MTKLDISVHNHVEINKEEEEIPEVEQCLFLIMLKLTLLLMSIYEKNTKKETLSEFPQMFFGCLQQLLL